MRSISSEYVVLGICAALFLGAAAFPAYLHVRTSEVKEYVADIEGKLEDARFREAHARSVKQLLADTQPQRDALEGASLPKDGAAQLINLLERDARAAGVAFSIGGVSVDPKDGPLDALKITMLAEGTFASVMRLIRLVETVPYAATVDAVVLERGERGAWSATLSIAVAMRKDI